MAYGMALILIIIVLISNLLANALRKYYGKKVKNELMHKIESNNVNFTTEKIMLYDISFNERKNTVTAFNWTIRMW
jgi:hypothetical protein